MSTLDRLAEILAARRYADPASSYVASLHHKGLDRILQKVGEEAIETVLAGKDAATSDAGRQALVAECADLWFHSLVMLSHLGLSHQDVLAVLENRLGTSGHDEKAARGTKSAAAASPPEA